MNPKSAQQSFFDIHSGLASMKAQVVNFAVIFWLTCSLMWLPGLVSAEDEISTTGAGIRGEVRIKKNLTAQRMRFRLYPDFKPVPPPTAEQKREDEWQNVVVYLESTASMPEMVKDDTEQLQMAQLGETFIPHVLPVVVGSTVEFPNQDPIFHNVFSLSGTKTFDLGRYPKGESRSVIFEQPGIVPVFCHLHSDMSAIIVVLDTPFFAVPDPDGQYQIDNIPPGTYTLVAWHVRSERVEQQVEVIAGQMLEFDIAVPIEDDEIAGQ